MITLIILWSSINKTICIKNQVMICQVMIGGLMTNGNEIFHLSTNDNILFINQWECFIYQPMRLKFKYYMVFNQPVGKYHVRLNKPMKKLLHQSIHAHHQVIPSLNQWDHFTWIKFSSKLISTIKWRSNNSFLMIQLHLKIYLQTQIKSI